DRGRGAAARAAWGGARAARSVGAVGGVTGGSGDRHAAADAYRAYMLMLLISAPVFIDDPAARSFLAQAQDLGGEMTRTLALAHTSTDRAAGPGGRLDDAMQQLQSAAAPLLQLLRPQVPDSIH